jgi:transposase
MSLLLSRKEKEALVIKLAKEDKAYREIAKAVHISPAEIKKIIDKYTGDTEPLQNNKEKQQQKPKSHYAQAFQMFREKKSLTQVVVELDINAVTVSRYYDDYLTLKRMDILVEIYPEILQNYNWNLFYHLFRKIKEEGLNKQDITELLQNKNEFKDLNYELEFYNKRISELKSRKLALEQEINYLKAKRDNYDGINPI